MHKKILLCCIFITIGFCAELRAQKTYVPFDRVTSQDVNRQLYEMDSIIHLSYKPLLLNKSEYDTLITRTQNRYVSKKYTSWVGRKVFQENLVVIDTGDLYVTFDVLMNLELGTDLENVDKQITTNTRGLLIQGNITKKIYFRTDFYETQSYFPVYVDSMIGASGTVPGQGKAKNFKQGGWDYPMVTGIVNFQATKNVNVQFGQDKQFIGNGYRSLLLSDNASPYLFFQLGLNFFENKLNYHANWASLQTLDKIHGLGGDDLFVKRNANFNYLSFKPNSFIEIGGFEGVIWETWNPQVKNIPFDPLFLNPVPFVNSMAKKSDTLVNSILGLNVFVKPFEHVGVYGQLSHGVEKGGAGFQIGAKWYDVFHLKGLNLQAEYNTVGENVYGNKNDYVDYYQYNQPLTVQFGDNFSEVVGVVNYRFKRIFLYARSSWATLENSTNSTENIMNYEANMAFLMNPITNLMVNMGVRYRNHSESGTTNWVYFGLKTNLRNLYYDF